jgi:hypothetical protein
METINARSANNNNNQAGALNRKASEPVLIRHGSDALSVIDAERKERRRGLLLRVYRRFKRTNSTSPDREHANNHA